MTNIFKLPDPEPEDRIAILKEALNWCGKLELDGHDVVGVSFVVVSMKDGESQYTRNTFIQGDVGAIFLAAFVSNLEAAME